MASWVYVPLDAIVPDMNLRVLSGDRIPVDGTILRGGSAWIDLCHRWKRFGACRSRVMKLKPVR